MYSNKENVNILTSLLVAHGIHHAVVCPGSRNAAIVHNLNECPDITCYPVTDERSAGFYALGMTQALKEPVVVCVTSGTALLNLTPAVAEAYYQHQPVVVISADRPQQWIDQLDGQTLPQPDALGRFVCKAVSLPEPHDEDTCWYCNRLINEALMEKHAPVHINVPITEPLFAFTTPELPTERKIELTTADISNVTLTHVCRMFMQAKRPMLIAGQPMNPLMDEAIMQIGDDESYVPDFVLYTGGSIVSKRLKRFLRKAKETWVVNREGEVTDTFMNLTHVIQGDGEMVADMIRFNLEEMQHPFVKKWEMLLAQIRQQIEANEPPYSQAAIVKYFEQKRGDSPVHYANSMAIRLANTYAKTPVYCNRGVNGIEGSLSTAAGFSVVTDENVFCVIGDLSFFYDQNALWNQNLRGNFRILLMNNGKGVIFDMLPGLEQSPARDKYVAAEHHANAEGICQQNNVNYRRAENMKEMQEGIDWLIETETEYPLLLEVFL
ncbi:2-succinyl-5-enolpyruvyl-6-hydroxy-3-cyclohexene-1-carboxylate synthase [Prevotella sp. E2-28]|uniref:2-succinyl-5-enolpyruvyl-6-hydroxy-3- cyclohexene-1-carboxylate synthase n=1 Tax=Prevotella sp. E2-28 TaxID=2913620 RepID=UPI001EDB4B3B|nr:2-succinyl-5-enolpyruvyl-6-hydroxy-3-cyclohexene-1-carboxylate synthase [Prevotella sp. E2-28]UKK53059.1 thiamine pyrophosphate-dependent enzyme [Prevotella sp. E2-28]